MEDEVPVDAEVPELLPLEEEPLEVDDAAAPCPEEPTAVADELPELEWLEEEWPEEDPLLAEPRVPPVELEPPEDAAPCVLPAWEPPLEAPRDTPEPP